MPKVPLRKMLGLLAVSAAAVAVLRVVRSSMRAGSGSAALPSIGSDTWPPVPTNPDRAA